MLTEEFEKRWGKKCLHSNYIDLMNFPTFITNSSTNQLTRCSSLLIIGVVNYLILNKMRMILSGYMFAKPHDASKDQIPKIQSRMIILANMLQCIIQRETENC
ncbi:unnamed protein product [Heterobilharzia americana]|nr:unnamed protein product [Heterobilharzia americana]